MSTDSSPEATHTDRYTIRPFETGDIDDFLELDRLVWGRERSPEWFRWKYIDNPSMERTPVFVAEYDDEIVGVRPFLGFELRIGEESVSAYQPADTMVHPDHRRSGVFRRMTTHALSAYQGGEPALFFNFPNEYARPGYLDLGWRVVAPKVTYYRIETPSAIPTEDSLPQPALGALEPVLDGYYAVRRRLSRPPGGPPGGLTVRQVDGVATSRLAVVHRQRQSPAIHAARTEAFLDWRLSSPIWDQRTYFVQESDEEPLAAVVARSRSTSGGFRLTQIADVAPLTGGDRWRAAVWTGLRAVVATHPETDLFAVGDGAVPHEILTAMGFLPDDSLPLSRFASFDSKLVCRPNDDPTDESVWQIGGRAIDDPDNWCVTFVERDTA